MRQLTVHLDESLADDLTASAAAEQLSIDEYLARAVRSFQSTRHEAAQQPVPGPSSPDSDTPARSAKLQAEMDAFFSNPDDYELCVRQMTELGRRGLRSVEWKS